MKAEKRVLSGLLTLCIVLSLFTGTIAASAAASAAPVFTDGFGNPVTNADSYVAGTTANDKGYTFAGWIDREGRVLASADAAAVGAVYTAKWTRNETAVRTTRLDLRQISEDNPFGAAYDNGVYTNAAEGWRWDVQSKTLTLSNATFDVNDPDADDTLALPDGASIAMDKHTTNTVINGSADESSCGILAMGALTIAGSGELFVSYTGYGIFAMDSITVNAPITAATASEDGVAVLGRKGLEISEGFCIQNPVGGYVGDFTGAGTVFESDGETPTGNLAIVAASAAFTDGFGRTITDTGTYRKGATTNDMGYTFAGWFDGDGTELTDAAAAVPGMTYTAKWTKNGKTVRTQPLDLSAQAENLENAEEGWRWNAADKTLTLNGCTIHTAQNTVAAVTLPEHAVVTTENRTENSVFNSSVIDFGSIGVGASGALTVEGSGKLLITGRDTGILAMGDITVNAPIHVSCMETGERGAAILTSDYQTKPKIQIASSLYIQTPNGGTIGSSDAGDFIAERDSQTPAKEVIIGRIQSVPVVPATPGSSIFVSAVKNGKITVSSRTAVRDTVVTITVTPDKGYALETLTVTDRSGNQIKLADQGSGKYTFIMPASSVTVAAIFMEDNAMLNFFVDVPASAYYYEAVLWAAKTGITGGTDAAHFSPAGICTRAQAVVFLWRAAGSPAPKSSAMPFTDVAAGSYYHDAVLWAVENGITTGTSASAFSPNTDCTRGQIISFLWRSQNSPAADTANPFTDVAADAYYAAPVLWATKEHVTGGTTAATFIPDANCTRAQIVTFLWRALSESHTAR